MPFNTTHVPCVSLLQDYVYMSYDRFPGWLANVTAQG